MQRVQTKRKWLLAALLFFVLWGAVCLNPPTAFAATTSITLDNALPTYSDANYEYNAPTKVLTIKTATNDYDITGDGAPFDGKIVLNNTASNVTITLNNLYLRPSAGPAIELIAGVTPFYNIEIGIGTNYLMGAANYAGIYVPSNTVLSVFDGAAGGSLYCRGGAGGAGIGGNTIPMQNDSGNININSGTITAEGKSGGAGIGGATQGDSLGIIMIAGGTVIAKADNAAGIGGGENGGNQMGKVTISGGTVTATGAGNAAGIGGGFKGDGGPVEISGTADVTATGGDYGAGIGGGLRHAGVGGNQVGLIEIKGGTVKATGGYGGGAGIGGGQSGNGDTVIISGSSNVVAKGGIGATGGGGLGLPPSGGGAGIGGGHNGNGGAVTVTDSAVITATGGAEGTSGTTGGGAGIGGGYAGQGAMVAISVTADITATASEGSAGIGSGKNGTAPGVVGIHAGGTISRTKVNSTLDLSFGAAPEYHLVYDKNIATYPAITGNAPTPATDLYHIGGTTTDTVLGAGTLALANHTFNGWNTLADGTGTPHAAASTIPYAANTTLYAQFLPIPVTGVTVTPATLTLIKGAVGNIQATIAPANAHNKNGTWTSDNLPIATVAGAGLNAAVTAADVGTANITVTTADGGHTATCALTVIPVPITPAVSPTALQLDVGKTGTITVFLGQGATASTSATIQSDNPAIATVSTGTVAATGTPVTIQGVGGGTTNIRIQWAGGPSAGTSSIVTVKVIDPTGNIVPTPTPTPTPPVSGGGTGMGSPGHDEPTSTGNATYTLRQIPSQSNQYTAICDQPFSSFNGVSIDGNALRLATDYAAWQGSTHVKLLSDYIQGLTDGAHSITLSFTGGSTTAKFTVEKQQSGGIISAYVLPGDRGVSGTTPTHIAAQSIEEGAEELTVE